MFCLLSKFHMSQPFRLPVKQILKLPDAKQYVPLRLTKLIRHMSESIETFQTGSVLCCATDNAKYLIIKATDLVPGPL